MTAPKSEYRIRLVLEQREPDESLVWREAGVSEQNQQVFHVHSEPPEMAFHRMTGWLLAEFVAEYGANWKPEGK